MTDTWYISGPLAIGTDTPRAQLHVEGDLRVTTAAAITGTLTADRMEAVTVLLGSGKLDLGDKLLKSDARMTSLENRARGLEDRVAKLEDRMTKLEGRTAKLEDRMAKLEDALASHTHDYSNSNFRVRTLTLYNNGTLIDIIPDSDGQLFIYKDGVKENHEIAWFTDDKGKWRWFSNYRWSCCTAG